MSKIFRNKNMLQKIAIVLLITILVYFTIPTLSFASWGGDMLKVITQLFAALGDTVMGAMNHFMLGTDKMIGSVMLSQDNPSITDSDGALYAGNAPVNITLDQNEDEEKIDGGLWDSENDDWEVPNLLYSPEAIFSNSIAALDVNFLRPNEYEAVQEGNDNAEKLSQSAAGKLQETIGSWYVAFRNIAIVALLTILVYIGIRILICSTSADKAKYKESLKDWLVAMCLVFIMHFIMSAILMVVDQISLLFGDSASGIIVKVGDSKPMKLSLMGVARLRVQSTDAGISATFCIMYWVLVFYTISFTVIYLKRFLYMAFLTMIAPLVAITYPLDKMGDGKAQAFNYWFKEYLMNAILQPLHLILYTTLIGAAQDLVYENFIYSLVAIGFLIPAEKFIKTMFGFNKSDSAGTLSGVAAGALGMKALDKMSKVKQHPSGGNDKGGNNRIRTADKGPDSTLTGNSEYDGLDTVNFGDNQDPNRPLTGLGQGADTGESSESSYLDRLHDMSENGPAMREHEDDLADISKDGAIMKNMDMIPDREITNRERFKNTAQNISKRATGAASYVAQGAKKAAASPLGKTAIRGAKSIGKATLRNSPKILGGAAKLALKGTTTALGTGIGLAAGIASGDLSKAFSYAAAGGIAGSAIGNNTANAIGSLGKGGYNTVKNTAGNIVNAYREEKYGLAEADKKRQDKINQREMKNFMKDEEQLAAAKKTQVELAKQGQDNVRIEDIMKSRYDYISAGIKDDNEIRNAQIAEYKTGGINGSSHGNYVSIAQAANDLGINASTFSDTKKYNEFHDTITAKLGSEQNGVKAMKMMAEIKGKSAIAANERQGRRRMQQRESNN